MKREGEREEEAQLTSINMCCDVCLTEFRFPFSTFPFSLLLVALIIY